MSAMESPPQAELHAPAGPRALPEARGWLPEPAWRADITSVYVHIPFCRHRCGYCSFSVVAGRNDLVPPFLEAIARELAHWPVGPPLKTLYWGGGTPSHISLQAADQLAAELFHRFPADGLVEWTVEANPSDVTDEWCRQMAQLGVTRISLGVQSFDEGKLRFLERDHTGRTAREAARAVHRAGLVLSVDLIFAVPGESLSLWKQDLQEACSLEPHHVSTYALTWEPGTRFYAALKKGRVTAVAEDQEAQMYEWAIEYLQDRGWQQYEVSNFALSGYRCRHNELYWTGGNYLGFGPGAASHRRGYRWMNHRSLWNYLRRLRSRQSPVAEWEVLSPESMARERLVFGLRRCDGVDRRWFAVQTGFELEPFLAPVYDLWLAWGLLEDDGQSVRLTRRGLMVSDSILPELL
ncbi:MAG: coproporphyrinogen III oxidase [Pirellulaceae bacterium]|nr:MAG: coproporphyrinogen III oxidase [Pirellulaceae bacterium]